jgi:hypothetical protein
MIMKKRRLLTSGFVAVQVVVVAAFAGSLCAVSSQTRDKVRRTLTGRAAYPVVTIEDDQPLRVEPLYDDPDLVSDEELAAVLEKIRPKFPLQKMRPNHVEHALRTWGIDATFAEPGILSGIEMRDFLIDHSKFITSWGKETPALLQPERQGVAIRWGKVEGASVHHDHLLASLTEAGITRSQPIYAPGRQTATLDDILQQALLDVRLDEREVEWSVMAFALWLPPNKSWTTADGRQMSFDLLAKRLIRGHNRFGVCSGTHRVYSLMLLARIDEMMRTSGHADAEDGLLSDPVLEDVYEHLAAVRDLISVSQFDEGYWPANWYDGAEAVAFPNDDEDYRKVIATGHHLEWLAIAPEMLHPPREQIRKAAKWIIQDTLQQSDETLSEHYTFYSHVGNALALWRKTRPADFWQRWRETHPYQAE